MTYAILMKPISNIPFFESMKTMCLEETKIMFEGIGLKYDELYTKAHGKGTYVYFELTRALEPETDKELLIHISKLSYYYTLFKVTESGLVPFDPELKPFFEDDLSVRLKYSGKTNESFTRMMLNVGVYSSQYADMSIKVLEHMNETSDNMLNDGDYLQILDPVCGKGTALFEGLIAGYRVYGLDKHRQSIQDLQQYFVRYLKEGRYKHGVSTGKALVAGKNRGEVLQVDLGVNKEEVKKRKGLMLKAYWADTKWAGEFLKKNSIHCIIGDLPYGVQHIGKEGQSSVRSLQSLVKETLPSWTQTLKKGGTLVLSWNTFTDTREQLTKILEEAGLKVLDSDMYLQFHHRVSQAINRDIIVAMK